MDQSKRLFMSFYEIAARWNSEDPKKPLSDIMQLMAEGILPGHGDQFLEAGLMGWFDNIPDGVSAGRPARNETAANNNADLWREILVEARANPKALSALAGKMSRPHHTEENEFTDWSAISVAENYKLLKEMAYRVPPSRSSFSDAESRRTILERIAIERVEFQKWCLTVKETLPKFWFSSQGTSQKADAEKNGHNDLRTVSLIMKERQTQESVNKYRKPIDECFDVLKTAHGKGRPLHQKTVCEEYMIKHPDAKISSESLLDKVKGKMRVANIPIITKRRKQK